MLKKILLILGLATIWMVGISQSQNIKYFSYNGNENFSAKTDNQILVDKFGRVYDWSIFGHVCPGCPSFYTKIVRSTYPVDGRYIYNVYCFSNSYNIYGFLAGTYLRRISVNKSNLLGGMENIVFLEYFLINPKNSYFDGVNIVATFYSLNPNDVVTITWQNSVVY